MINKETYNNFIGQLKSALIDFILEYNIKADCKFPQNENDDTQYTLFLGEKYGKVNILFESYSNLPKNEMESNTYIIPMKFHTYRDEKNVFNFDCGNVNSKDGTFILFSKENDLESLKTTFMDILQIWIKENKRRDSNKVIISYN